MRRYSLISILLALVIAGSCVLAFAEGSTPGDDSFDCMNHGPSPCPDGSGGPPPPPGGGGGGEGGDDGPPDGGQCTDPGGEGPSPNSGSTDGVWRGVDGDNGCRDAHCNSSLRLSAYGSPAKSFYQGNAISAGINFPGIRSEADAGKRAVVLMRQDFFITGNGGVPMELMRTYNNLTATYAANDDGRTILGPKWHLSYDMHIKIVSDSSDTFVRMIDGSQVVLYHTSPPGVWISFAGHGPVLKLERLANEYKLTTPDPNVWYTFEPTIGKLKSIRYRNGNMLTFTRNTSMTLTRIDFDHETNDTDNRYLALEYDWKTYGDNITHYRLIRAKLYPGGTTMVEYTYDDTFGCLKEVKNRWGEIVEKYEYSGLTGDPDTGMLTAIYKRTASGELQRSRVYEYNETRQLISVKDGGGTPILTNSLGENTHETTMTLASGITYYYVLDHSRNAKETHLFDANGRPLRTEYQDFRPDVGWCTHTPGGCVPENCQLLKTSYNDQGDTITYEYLDETTDSLNERARRAVKKITYADGNHIDFEYDTNYRVTAVKNPLNRNSYYSYDSEGNAVWYQNPMGETYYYTYDSKGRLTKKEFPTSATIEWAYNDRGQVTDTTGTEGRCTHYEYDSDGKLESATGLGLTSSYEYDDRDRPTTVTVPDGTKRSVTYDGSLKRITSATDAMGNTTIYEYNTSGSLSRIVDAKGNSIRTYYDSENRPICLTDQRDKPTTYTYDAMGRIATERNALNEVTQYTYYDQANGGCGCQSGAAGKLASIIRPDGSTTTYTYELGRLKTAVYSDECSGNPCIEYTYDAAGRRTAMLDRRLPSSYLGGQTFYWEYDANDRLTTETYPDGAKVVYGYDSLGRRISMKDPNGNVTTYHYANDTDNKKLDYISHPFSGQTDFVYRPANGLLDYEYRNGNGTVEVPSYDSSLRVSGFMNYSDQQGLSINEESYTFNDNSMRTRIDYYTETGPISDYKKTYTYDNLQRLLTEEKVNKGNNAVLYRRTYEYDPAGNRTKKSHFNGTTTSTVDYSFNAANQLEDDGTLTYLYSNNGALSYASDKATEEFYFEHNSENRLGMTATWNPDLSSQEFYYYDAFGRRLLTYDYVAGTLTKYYYDGMETLLTKELPSGWSNWRTKTVYTLRPGATHQIISERVCEDWDEDGSVTAWSDRWYHYDLVGNVIGLSDSNGALIEQYDQEAYGEVLTGSQSGRHLTGKEYHSGPGLYYFGQRWYNPSSAQWIEPEPTGADGPNLYWYGRSEAVNGFDGEGHSWYNPFDWMMNIPGCDSIGGPFFQCYARCLGQGGGFHKASFLSELPKKMVPPFRVVKQSQRMTTLLSSIGGLFPRGGFMKPFLRGAGRVLSGIGTPLLLWDGYQAVKHQAQCAGACSGDSNAY